MGLGPSICRRCEVIAEHRSIPRLVSLNSGHIVRRNVSMSHCPVCGDEDSANFYNAQFCGDTKVYDDNLKFWKFANGQDPAL